MDPAVSIIIPTLNRAALLRRVLPSYLSQRVLIEIILIDDSTNLEDRKDLQALAAEQPRIVLIQNDKKEGMTRSRNIGVQKARGRFIFFGEDDLILPPDHLATLLAHQEANHADIIGGRVVWLLREENPEQALERANQKRGKLFNTFLMNFHCDLAGTKDVLAPFLQSAALIKKDVFQKVQFDEAHIGFSQGYCWREETDFFMSANEKGFRTIFCPHAVAFNFPTQPGGTHQWSHWKTEYWILRNQWYLLRKHKVFIRNQLNNRYPISLLWLVYCCSRLYGKGRNIIWRIKQKTFNMLTSHY